MTVNAAPAAAVAATAAVLVVDDETGVRDLIVRWLQRAGHRLSWASDAGEALQVLERHPVEVAVLDLRMPGHDGLWLAAQIRQRSPETAIVMATGVRDVSSAVSSLRSGVVDYLVKPFSREQLHEAIDRALEWHQLAVDGRERAEIIADERRERLERLERRLDAFVITSPASLAAALEALSAPTPEWLAHARRVADLAVSIGDAMHLPADGRDLLRRAALVHGIGRLTMPEGMWMKAGPLTQSEQIAVRALPGVAASLLGRCDYLAPVAPLVSARHEHVDGSGYPDGLRGDSIPLASRILAVADTFDTLIRPLHGRRALSSSEAFEEIRRASGTQFDPQVVRALRWLASAG